MERAVRELWAEPRVLLGLHSSSSDEAPTVTRADLPLTPLAFLHDHVSPGHLRGGWWKEVMAGVGVERACVARRQREDERRGLQRRRRRREEERMRAVAG
jgi:hypothetical protein